MSSFPLHQQDPQGHLQAGAAGDDPGADEAGGGDEGERERLTVVLVVNRAGRFRNLF